MNNIARAFRLGRVVAAAVIALAAAGPAPAADAPHSFVLTYRDFGPVNVASDFRPADGYAVRFEGCYARHSVEAICGFTLRATRPLTVTNIADAAHAGGSDGSWIRTCCMFVQGDPRGFPIVPAATAPAGVGVVSRPLAAGESLDVLLRIPDYHTASPVASITFAHGDGDKGVTFPTRVAELP